MKFWKFVLSKVFSNFMLLEGRLKWITQKDWVVLPNGMKLFFDFRDRSQVYGYVTTIWDYNVYGEVNGGVVFDVGANIGTFSLKVFNFVEKVFAIEPVPRIYQMLLKNIKKNSLSNIIPINVAFGNYDGSVDLSITRQFFGEGHEIKPLHSPKNKISVPIMKFDSFLMKFPEVKEIDTVKVDIEGYEPEMLLGAKETLKRGMIQNFSIAVYHFMKEDDVVKDILENFGYKTKSNFFWDGDVILHATLKK